MSTTIALDIDLLIEGTGFVSAEVALEDLTEQGVDFHSRRLEVMERSGELREMYACEVDWHEIIAARPADTELRLGICPACGEHLAPVSVLWRGDKSKVIRAICHVCKEDCY